MSGSRKRGWRAAPAVARRATEVSLLPTRMQRRFALWSGLFAVTTLAGCSEEAAVASERTAVLAEPTAVATLGNQPMVDIGIADGERAYLLHNAVSSRRLADGRIVVLNAGSHELRIYDRAGRHISSSGGRGSGPGEFRWPARVWLTHPDTLLVFDPAADMETVFDGQGRFVRATPATTTDAPFPRDAWLYGAAFIDGPRRIERRPAIRAVIDALPADANGDSFRFVLVDEFNRLWLRTPLLPGNAPVEWHVHGDDGAPLARVITPPSFELHDIGEDYVLGRSWDAMNVEHIRLYALQELPVPASVDATSGTRNAGAANTRVPDEATLRPLRSLLRNMMAKQEIFYSRPANGYRYAGRVDQLEWAEDTTGLAVHILAASPQGWSAIVVHRGEGVACGVAQGVVGPVGWTPGIVVCS